MSSMTEEEDSCSIQRPFNAISQSPTIGDLSRDDDTVANFRDTKEEKANTLSLQSQDTLELNQKEFDFKYTDGTSDSPPLHSHQKDRTLKVPGQERITIVEDITISRDNIHQTTRSAKPCYPWIEAIKHSRVFIWIQAQCVSAENRYAFQMSVAFTLAALFVIVEPISNIFPNAFWVGVSVVTVLDNTVGGFLNLSVQRTIGTILGGGSSIVVMTITRVAFHPNWDWQASLMLCCLLFIQVFFISKVKMMPNMAYAGSIGLLTTVIITLSGYSNLIHDRISYTAELGAWRTLNLIIGIVIASIVSLFVFPLKARSVMRKNLGKALEDAADLYQKSSEYYLDFSGSTTSAVDESLASNIARQLPRDIATDVDLPSIGDILSRTFSTRVPEIGSDLQDQIRQQTEESNRFWTHDSITSISNKAFGVLAKLQTESTRLRNVSNEYYVQTVFHIFGGGRDRCKRDLRRAKRYNEAIEAMKRVVWPLVSFRLLLPLISLSQTTHRLDEAVGVNTMDDNAAQDSVTLKERITPTRETLDSFSDSLHVMLRLGQILKNHRKPLSEFSDDWMEIDRMVTAGNLHIQRELRQTVKAGMYAHNLDGLKLLSYYGFLVRCSMIWDGLKTVVEKLSPLNGTLSRASSMGISTPLPNREFVNAPE